VRRPRTRATLAEYLTSLGVEVSEIELDEEEEDDDDSDPSTTTT